MAIITSHLIWIAILLLNLDKLMNRAESQQLQVSLDSLFSNQISPEKQTSNQIEIDDTVDRIKDFFPFTETQRTKDLVQFDFAELGLNQNYKQLLETNNYLGTKTKTKNDAADVKGAEEVAAIEDALNKNRQRNVEMEDFIRRKNEEAARRNQQDGDSDDGGTVQQTQNKKYDFDDACQQWLNPFNTDGVTDENGVIGFQCNPQKQRLKGSQRTLDDSLDEKYLIFVYFFVFVIFLVFVIFFTGCQIYFSRFLYKWFIVALRRISIDVVIIISMATFIQILYFNGLFILIMKYYFNIFAFTIGISAFALIWLFIAVLYIFNFQNGMSKYQEFESQWKKRHIIKEEYEAYLKKTGLFDAFIQNEEKQIKEDELKIEAGQIKLNSEGEEENEQDDEEEEDGNENEQDENGKLNKSALSNPPQDSENPDNGDNANAGENSQIVEKPDRKQIEYYEKLMEYFLMKQDFVFPITHLPYLEVCVLRQDFNFSQYLSRCSAFQLEQVFVLSGTSLFIMGMFFIGCWSLNLLNDWFLELCVLSFFPIFIFFYSIYMKAHLAGIKMNLTQQPKSSLQVVFLNLKKNQTHQNLIMVNYMHPYLTRPDLAPQKRFKNRHQMLFQFNSPFFIVRQATYMILVQTLWVIVVVFQYDKFILNSTDCQIMVLANSFLILLNVFYMIPSFLKYHVMISNIHMMQNPQIIQQTVFASRKEVTMAFMRFFRFLKQFDYGNRDQISKNRQFIQSQIDEIFIDQLQYSTEELNQLIYMVGIELDEDEMYHFKLACSGQEDAIVTVDKDTFIQAVEKFTFNVTIQPYKFCLDQLQRIFHNSQSVLIDYLQDYLEEQQDKMNISQKDRNIIINQVEHICKETGYFNLEDFSSLIRDNIEMMPR